MNELEQARSRINEIDAQMAALFEQRMQAVSHVAQYKAATGKPVFDPEREEQVITRNSAYIKEETLRPYYERFQRQTMAVSRAYQRSVLGQNVAAYQGVPGAWSHIALKRLLPLMREISFPTWEEVCLAVENGKAQFGVLPFENSNAGDVGMVQDLLYTHPLLEVVQMCDLPIRQDLLVLPGTKPEDIQTVISHPQALSQSRPFLLSHGFVTKSWGNTADAARHVAELGDKTIAAIASAETAKLYGLEIAAAGINEDGDNTTRFVVVQRTDKAVHGIPKAGNRISLLLTVDNKPGRLARAIELIGRYGLNMECIKSRPLPHVPFEYYFYTQLIYPESGNVDAMLKELDTICRTVRVLGVYELAYAGEEK